MTDSPVAGLLREAVEGRFPAADGRATVVPTWRPGLEAVLAFTGHAVVCVDPDRQSWAAAVLDEVGTTYPAGLGGASDARTVLRLAGPGAWIDSLDVLLAGVGGSADPELDLAQAPSGAHPRTELAASLRDDVRSYVAGDVLVTSGTGLGGLREVSIEVSPSARGAGLGRQAAIAARELAGPGEPVLAAVAPGNSASLRSFLGAGFRPIGGVQLWRPARRDDETPHDGSPLG